MRRASAGIGKPFWLSVMIGAFGGVITQIGITSWNVPVAPSELWAIPVLVTVYGLIAVPFVALGLVIFGLPATVLLRRRARETWVGLAAAIWGAAAGKLMFFAVDHLLFFGLYEIGKLQILDLGIVYGLPTAVAWWLLYRRTFAAD